MDKISILLWVLIIISTATQYFLGYYRKKVLSFGFPVIFTILIVLLFVFGKNVTLLSACLVIFIGNIWFLAYYTSGKNRYSKKIQKELDIMKAKDNQK